MAQTDCLHLHFSEDSMIQQLKTVTMNCNVSIVGIEGNLEVFFLSSFSLTELY